MEAMTELKESGRDFVDSEDLRKGLRVDTGSTERIRSLSSALRSTRPGICLHAARAYTEVFSQTEGEPVEIRFAKAFYKTLQDLPAVIHERELIVGLSSCACLSRGK